MNGFKHKFTIEDINLKYIYDPTECDTCRPDYIVIKAKNIKDKSFILFKTICDIAHVDAIDFYEKYRDVNDYVGIQDEMYFYMDDFMFVISWESGSWKYFVDYEEDVNEFVESMRCKFIDNIDFHINEDDLLTRPILMKKCIDNNHVVIKETKQRFEHKYHVKTKTVHINKTEPIPYIEYDLINGFDIYEDWPFRKPLSDLIIEEIDKYVDDYDQPFKISFGKFSFPLIGSAGYGCFMYVYQEIHDNKLSIDMVHDLYSENTLLVKIPRDTLREVIESIDISDIRYNSSGFEVYSEDINELEKRIKDSLAPYIVTDYEVSPYNQWIFEMNRREFKRF